MGIRGKKNFFIILLIGICFSVLLAACSQNRSEESILTEESVKGQEAEESKEKFDALVRRQGISETESAEYFEFLVEKDVFENGTMELEGLVIDDMDGNGQKDVLAMVQDPDQKFSYGTGSLFIFMNEDEPYCYRNENFPYYGFLNVVWADLDNDGNVEIALEAQGTGNGGAGDWSKAVFKYKEHAVTEMEMPSDLEEYYDKGIQVEVYREPQENMYSAYCPYLDDTIVFEARNIEGYELPETSVLVGGNVRGYFGLECIEYEGKDALQMYEYLHGEGGIAHGIANARFVVTWDEAGEGHVVSWGIDRDRYGGYK